MRQVERLAKLPFTSTNDEKHLEQLKQAQLKQLNRPQRTAESCGRGRRESLFFAVYSAPTWVNII